MHVRVCACMHALPCLRARVAARLLCSSRGACVRVHVHIWAPAGARLRRCVDARRPRLLLAAVGPRAREAGKRTECPKCPKCHSGTARGVPYLAALLLLSVQSMTQSGRAHAVYLRARGHKYVYLHGSPYKSEVRWGEAQL